MRGLKRVSQTGQIVYRSLRFTGDNFVKTAVTARFLAEEEEPRTGAADYAVTERNYSLVYEKTSDYNGMTAYVFRLKPRRKRVGLLRGELWLDANTAAPLRLWGDFVKSPSVYIRSFRLVQDYQNLGACSLPLRLLLMVQTRIVGKVEIAVWLHPADGQPATKGTAARGSDSDATQGFAHSSIQEKDGMTQ